MIEKLPDTHDNVLGYRFVGDITAEDYDTLTPEVAAAVAEHGQVRLLLDMTEFRWEKLEAWGSDLAFGRELRENVERLAVVGRHMVGKYLTRAAAPFYAQEARFFGSEDAAGAWAWLNSDTPSDDKSGAAAD
ncbi:MAG: STAS/SEC14 domain-containing protein [Jiangellales bacterium]